jgi:putative copper resistance protein D
MDDTSTSRQQAIATVSPAGALSLADLGRVETLQIIVKKETPFLPKVAFTLISLASLGGAIFTGLGFGLEAPALGLRWFALWALALAGGFLAWRLFYLREHERDLQDADVHRLTTTALQHADRVARVVGILLVVASFGTLAVGYLEYLPIVRYLVVGGTFALGILMLTGVTRRGTSGVMLALSAILVVSWAVVDAGTDWHGLIRIAHLTAFSLWLGGALWNIAVAMPSGRAHPDVPSVLTGARQLDRFRWVVRFALPTIIVTGLAMAGVYTVLPIEWWLTFPGILIPLKVLAIVALVVVFITCPLFRQCSPVQGVCNVDDLANAKGKA